MPHEDRLDVLLSTGGAPDATGNEPQLVHLLDAAEQLAPLRMATPSPTFASRLHEQLLSHATALRADDPAKDENIYMDADPDTELTLETFSLTASQPIALDRRPEISTSTWHGARLWPVAVAVMLCLLFSGVFLAARLTTASPTTSSPTNLVRQHLASADIALQTYDALVASHADDAALASTLNTLLSEQQAAAQSLSAVHSGSDHNALVTQLADSRQRARNDLLASLPNLDWTSRVRVTTALGGLGKQVLTISTVRISHGNGDDDNNDLNAPWRIQVQGSDFVSGAIVLFAGQPGGTVISITPTRLVATWTDGSPPKGVSVGVENPGGTAAETTNVRFQSDD